MEKHKSRDKPNKLRAFMGILSLLKTRIDGAGIAFAGRAGWREAVKSKPVQRSLAHMKKNGWLVAIVEKYMKHPGMAFGRRIDCFGFGDLLACRPTMNGRKPAIALVQCCRDADMAEHRAKILGQPMEHWTQEERDESKEIFEKFKVWKASGGRVFLQGWGFKGRRGEKKWTLREEVL